MNTVPRLVLYAVLACGIGLRDTEAQNLKPSITSPFPPLISVDENVPVGTIIAVVSATDPENDPIVFSLDAASDEFLNIDNSGNLTLAKTLDREVKGDYEISVYVADQCQGCNPDQRKSEYHLILVVNDLNDEVPTFISTPYVARIAENATKGSSVIDVSAIDKDSGPNAQISYTFSPKTRGYRNPWQTNNFAISNHHGKITVSGPLDFENEQRYTLFVIAKDAGTPPLESETTVIVDVTDVSDNPPKFLRSIYLVEISENKIVGSTILQVQAVDGDAGVNNEVYYDIIAGNDERLFAVNMSSGELTLNGTIDAEKMDFSRITVRASEVGDPTSNSTALVLITVLDTNDNPPEFFHSSYHFSIREDLAKPGYIVTDQLNVQDKDINPQNRRFAYSLSGEDSKYFKIDSSSGLMTINASLDYEQGKFNFSFKVFANETDTAEVLSGVAMVTVELVNVNDNAPKFEKRFYNFSIDEDSPIDFVVGTVKATDADLGVFGEIKYELYGSGISNFKVDSNGTITTTKDLDYESVKEFEFYIVANDGGRFFEANKDFVTHVRITLRDINDNDPVFLNAPYFVNIMENQTAAVFVYQVCKRRNQVLESALRPFSYVKAVIEGDVCFSWLLQGKVVYNITDGDPNGHFEITPSGYILVKTALDAEVNSMFNLTIEAKDEGQPRRANTTVVSIVVDDVNDNDPVFNQSSYAGHVLENSNVSTSVATVYATDRDRDENGHVSYKITAGNVGNAFEVNNLTGVVTVKGAIDREMVKEFKLTVRAEDGGRPSSRKAFAELVISVLDENDNPPKFQRNSYEAEIAENSPAYTTVKPRVVIVATDADEGTNAVILFSLEGHGSHLFQINSTTATITTRLNDSLDRETNETYHLTLRATDGGNKTSTVPLVVKVTDVNDELPRFSQQVFYANVSEDAARGTIVARLTATDLDLLILNKEITYTSTGADAKFYINRATEFSQPLYVQDYREESPKDTSILSVRANDPDSGVNADIKFSIVGNATRYVKIDAISGFISQADFPLDRELSAFFNFTVRANDMGTPSMSTEVNVSLVLVDINDNSPTFNRSVYYGFVMENQPIGTPVLVVTGTDRDLGSNARLSYGVQGGDFRFSIDQDTGNITTAVVLDRERPGTETYTLTVLAADDAVRSRQGTTRVIVTVLDDNDHPPVFSLSKYTFYVSEGVSIGSSVGIVSATDGDEGQNAMISFLKNDNNGSFPFKVDNSTGVLTTSGILDREANTNFTFVIIVSELLLRTIVAQVNATDLDAADLHRTVHYRIEKGNEEKLFVIGELNGTVSLNWTGTSLDREKVAGYSLIIAAISKVNDTEQKSTATLTITVLDVNDFVPKFLPQSYSKAVDEDTRKLGDEEDRKVLTVSAKDDDEGANAQIIYAIVRGNEEGAFMLNNATGVLSKAKQLDREKTDFYSLLVSATDQGSPALWSITTVNITVRDVNDKFPEIHAQDIFYVQENTTAGTRITIINATDKDAGRNAEIKFTIISGNDDGKFLLNETSGELFTAGILDYDTAPNSYKLTIKAQDLGSTSLSTDKTITIALTNIDDNSPRFTE
ncbi:PREDICTED: protocadherin Fat 4-like, partial [Acropora digitifera]|uniref:protocadherin Fat 4-like n=1 Tax=Acropora digitifera TaxID=70779 RepID=UPI00077A80BE